MATGGGLESELNKLIDFMEAGQNITNEDIKTVCAGYEIFNMFQVGEVVVEGNVQKTLKVIRSLIGRGTKADMLTILLQQHFMSVYLVKSGQAPVGRRAFLIPKFRAQSGKYSKLQLERIIIALAEANAEMRRQRLPHEVVLEMLALSLSAKSKS